VLCLNPGQFGSLKVFSASGVGGREGWAVWLKASMAVTNLLTF